MGSLAASLCDLDGRQWKCYGQVQQPGIHLQRSEQLDGGGSDALGNGLARHVADGQLAADLEAMRYMRNGIWGVYVSLQD